MDGLEDEAIELLNQVEKAETGYKSKEAEFTQWKSKIDAEIQELGQSVSQQQQRIAQGEANRAQLLQSVEAFFLKQYTQLKKEYVDPLSALRGGVCSGCKLRVSDVTAERARGGSDIVTCEHCSRILYA
jgi:predicted  nucleic acid-binding Zn-ribbon protein